MPPWAGRRKGRRPAWGDSGRVAASPAVRLSCRSHSPPSLPRAPGPEEPPGRFAPLIHAYPSHLKYKTTCQRMLSGPLAERSARGRRSPPQPWTWFLPQTPATALGPGPGRHPAPPVWSRRSCSPRSAPWDSVCHSSKMGPRRPPTAKGPPGTSLAILPDTQQFSQVH